MPDSICCNSVISDSGLLGSSAVFASKYLPTFQRRCTLQKHWKHGFHWHCSEKTLDVATFVAVSHQTAWFTNLSPSSPTYFSSIASLFIFVGSLYHPLCLPPLIVFYSFHFLIFFLLPSWLLINRASEFIFYFQSALILIDLVKVKVKRSRYRPGVAQRVGRGIAPLFHDRGTRRGWVVSSTPQPHFTPRKDPVPILQEAGWAPGLVWTGGKSHPHQDSILDRPACSSVAILTELPGPQ